MVRASKLTFVLLLSLVLAKPAPEVADSPLGLRLQATFEKSISGSVIFTSRDGVVDVSVDLQHLPASGGPFLYHIHEKPVPPDGNCTGTLLHFNPYNGTTNGSTDALKELGDLSGKHGEINGTSVVTSYTDPYLSLNPLSPAFFGGLSVVVHFANNSRLACANITPPYLLYGPGSETALALETVLPSGTTSTPETALPDSTTLEPTTSSFEPAPLLTPYQSDRPARPPAPSVETATGEGVSIDKPGMAILALVGACHALIH